MNIDAKRENLRALANSLGISEEEAGTKLNIKVELFFSSKISGSKEYTQEVYELLSRTVESVKFSERETKYFAEIDIKSETSEKLYVHINNNIFLIDSSKTPTCENHQASHPLFLLLSACYTSAVILKTAIKQMPFSCKLPMKIVLRDLIDPTLLEKKINLDKTYLAGAGAIGNAVLWSFRHLKVQGELHICDDDKVRSGNLNRQIFFEEGDLNKFKAECLANKAQIHMPNLKLVKRTFLLQQLVEATQMFWMNRLISAVDSRLARRKLQGQFPKEIFDASTTDISEVVLHYNKLPNEIACMACTYSEDAKERSHEQNIAEALGVNIEEVRTQRISQKAAGIIIKKFPDQDIKLKDIVDEAYDSFYKAMCGQSRLKKIENGETLAPFCFISVLAGVMMSIEIVKRLTSDGSVNDYNFWKISAWNPPFTRMRKVLPRKVDCPVCSPKTTRDLINKKSGQSTNSAC